MPPKGIIRDREYSAVGSNLALDLPALYAFVYGRGAQEKTVAELKREFALDWALATLMRRAFDLDVLTSSR